MKFKLSTLFVLTLIIALFVKLGLEYPRIKKWRGFCGYVEKYREDQESHKYVWYFNRLFAKANDDSLPWLKSHRIPSIGVATNWYCLIRDAKRNKSSSFDNEHVISFLHSLEHATGSQPPKWWCDAVQTCEFDFVQGGYSFETGDFESPLHRSSIKHVFCPINADVVTTDGKIQYVDENGRFALPKEFPNDNEPTLPYGTVIAALVEKDRIWMTEVASRGGPHELYCVDAKTRAVLWTNEVNGCDRSVVMDRGNWRLTEFRAYFDIDLQNSNDHIITVHGISGPGFYAHAFDKSTGETLL